MVLDESAVSQGITPDVSQFSTYCHEIESLFTKYLNPLSQDVLDEEIIANVLNGEASAALRRLVPFSERRAAGIYFTNSSLAVKVATYVKPLIESGLTIVDPTCGAGNLLLACAEHLQCRDSLEETLELWERQLSGFDIQSEFVKAVKIRLVLLAAFKSEVQKPTTEIQLEDVFENILVSDVFNQLPLPANHCIVINPPFGYMDAPRSCTWATGNVQIAGWFIEQILIKAPTGQNIIAILPDVLRSGARYEKWRKMVSDLGNIVTIDIVGRFDNDTDVDVFILHIVSGISQKKSISWMPTYNGLALEKQKMVSDYFEVHVGSVVPHRDTLEGDSYPYIHARTTKRWTTLNNIKERRQTSNSVFTPPFVVVHRTSSPSDKNRCVATVIGGNEKVAVENHLLVLKPKEGGIKMCKKLVNVLQSQKTNEFMNQRIRCRHLTVASVKEILWSEA